MRNTRTRKVRAARKQNPGQVKDAVLRGQVVEAPNNWTILITENDMVELWPPGDHDGLMTHLGNLDQVVADFCKKADMPIPGVNETQGDQVKLPGDAATILGPDSSTKEFPKMKPEINERPGGLDQKGTTAPNTSLGPDSTSRNPKNFDPAINKRPRPNIERGGLPDTNLGEDSSGAATNWRDKRVRIQEDGRTRSGRRRRAQQSQDAVTSFLDYMNNYLTLENFALDKGLSEKEALSLIEEGKRLNEQADGKKARRRAQAPNMPKSGRRKAQASSQFKATLETIGDWGGEEEEVVERWNTYIAPMLEEIHEAAFDDTSGEYENNAENAEQEAWDRFAGEGLGETDRGAVELADQLQYNWLIGDKDARRHRAQAPMDLYEAQEAQLPGSGAGQQVSGMGDRLKQALDNYQTNIYVEASTDGTVHVFDANFDMSVDPFVALSELQQLPIGSDATAVWDALGESQAGMAVAAGCHSPAKKKRSVRRHAWEDWMDDFILGMDDVRKGLKFDRLDCSTAADMLLSLQEGLGDSSLADSMDVAIDMCNNEDASGAVDAINVVFRELQRTTAKKQEDHQSLHKVQKPKRGPGQLGVGKAQMGEEALAAAPGAVAQTRRMRRAFDDPDWDWEQPIISPVDPSAGRDDKWNRIVSDLSRLADQGGAASEVLSAWQAGEAQSYQVCIDMMEELSAEVDDFENELDTENGQDTRFDRQRVDNYRYQLESLEVYIESTPSEGGPRYAKRRNADKDPFKITPNEESAKILNKGENPSDPEEVISQSKGEKAELREKKEGFIHDSFEDRTPDPTAIYKDLRRARPSEDLLRDIMDPEKWAANNIFMPSNQSTKNKHRAQMFAEDEFQGQSEMDPTALHDYIEDLKRAASETKNDAMFDTLRNAEQAFEFGDYGEAYAQAEEAEQILDEDAWRVAHRPHSARVFKFAQWALGDDSSAVAVEYLMAQGYDELAASEMVGAYMQGDALDFQATYLIEEALGEVSKAARRQAQGIWEESEGESEDVSYVVYIDDKEYFSSHNKEEAWNVHFNLIILRTKGKIELVKEVKGEDPFVYKDARRQAGGYDDEEEGEEFDPESALIESWINGNREYVVDECVGKYELTMAVRDGLDPGGQGAFDRMMINKGASKRQAGPKKKSRRQASSITLEEGDYGTYLLVNDVTGEDILIQAEDDYSGVAETFGWPGPKHGDARQWLDEHLGETAEDPGYFNTEARRQAGPKLKENWGNDGAYGREIGAESAEELHALTMALGGDEVDWSKFKPVQPDGAPVDEQGVVDEQAAQVEARRPRRPFAGRSKQAALYAIQNSSGMWWNDRGWGPEQARDEYSVADLPGEVDADSYGGEQATLISDGDVYDYVYAVLADDPNDDELIARLRPVRGTEAGKPRRSFTKRKLKGEREDKEAVDPVAEQYWEGYQGEYGKQLTRGDTGDPKPGGLDKDKKDDKKKDKKKDKKPDLKSAGYKARKAAYLNARKYAQAVPLAQPVAPVAPTPGAAPVPGGAPAPGAPAPTPAAPAKPKGMPPGTGDAGLQTLGWTSEEIALLDEQDKKKILEIQLNKPGTKKTETPGAEPGTPKAPAAPEAPAAPATQGAPAPAKPIAPAARVRLAKLILRKINRRRVLAQAAQLEQPAPAPAAPVPATPSAPAPGGAPAGEVLPEFADAGGGVSEDGKALQLLTDVQEMEVSATSPAQVPALKASYLAQKLLTELGWTVQDAKKLYGLGDQKGLTSLFE